MRSSGVPARAASITARTASRTSSSASDAVKNRVRPTDVIGVGAASAPSVHLEAQPVERRRDLGVGAARPRWCRPEHERSVFAADAAEQGAAWRDRRWGR